MQLLIDVPTATVTTRLGVGSTETPVSDIQIIKQDFGVDADLQVSALGGVSAVKVGREIGTCKNTYIRDKIWWWSRCTI